MTESAELAKLRWWIRQGEGDSRRVECKLGGFPDLLVTVHRFNEATDGESRLVFADRHTFTVEAKKPRSRGPWKSFAELGMRPGQVEYFLTWPGEHYVLAWCQSGHDWWAYRRTPGRPPGHVDLEAMLAHGTAQRARLGGHMNTAVLLRDVNGIQWEGSQRQ